MSADLVRLTLHVLAASVWVGGQLVLAALLPALRRLSAEAPALVARAFARVAWPAYAMLLVTGVWNVRAEADQLDQGVLAAKLGAVAASGAAAWLHQRATGPRQRALSGAATGVFAIAALVLGLALSE